uniref:Ras family protein n=1 Tax=Heterorhabditis bacteriophora TaxID=37862 RepID=A0A1I7X2L4_HETBA
MSFLSESEDANHPTITTLKILIIGESGVGKSSLMLRFVDDTFDPEQAATIGIYQDFLNIITA